MAQLARLRQLDADCAEVAGVIHARPGIESKNQVADATGLSRERVARCIRHINSNETPYARVEYGDGSPKKGPYASSGLVRGWYPQGLAVYQPVMDQADEHSSLVERGVRRSRLLRLAFVTGYTSGTAQCVITSIQQRLAVDVETMSAADFESFEELFVEELELNGN
jgi:hypothetical protein